MGCRNTIPLPNITIKDVPQPISTIIKPIRRNSLLTNRISSIGERYQIIRTLGSDIIGTLFNARELQSGSIRTIREVTKHTMTKGIELFQEFNILHKLDHPNIIKSFEAYETAKNYYIVLENISGGPLFIREKKGGYEGALAKYSHELFSALNYLHRQEIAHCNLCPDFIVLSTEDDDAVLKIIGFNYAQKISEKKEIDLSVLKFEYASPEILNGEFSEKSDIWSAGVILYGLLTSRYPFPRGSLELTIKAIQKGNVDYTNSGFTNLSQPAQDLLKSILQIDPSLRPSCEKILQHPWFRESKQTLPITYNIAKKLSTFKINSRVARCILGLITTKLSSSKKDYTIINYFKSLDLDNDGKVSREEIINVFTQVGLNVINDIDFIMENLDYDSSGFIDYTELILALTNWEQELKKKNLNKAFATQNGYVSINYLIGQLPLIESGEWEEFIKQITLEKEKISLQNLKNYLKNQINGWSTITKRNII